MTDKNYRPCVGIALFNADNHVFVGERIDNAGQWQMPQGGMDEGEDPLTAALRELAEETGIPASDVALIGMLEDWLYYDIPQHVLDRLPWGKTYQGQRQKWVALRFTGNDKNVNLQAHNPPEFQNWQWLKPRDILPLIVPFKAALYRELIVSLERLVAGEGK